ncbi:type II toxin-antitoxin system RelE/ParE family toxin [Kribbella sp. CA-247076]|uniref:type II toxin-antitoxin system RelE/ParE family toxin n=1 Tax=Kribbella sp. CA-247076 TaxID=3239941 RepID=UPI003D91C5A2
MPPNSLVWSPRAVAQLDAAFCSRAPAEAARLVDKLANLPLHTGWGRPDEDEVMVLYCLGFRVSYQLVGAGTTIKVLEIEDLRT